jgi:putative DNA primase/helicase
MIAFADFLRIAGLIPREIVADSKWRRCKTQTHPGKKNGSYKLLDSGTLGFAQDFAIHPSPLMWRAERTIDAPKIDHAAIAERRREEQQALIKSTREAREFYAACKPLRGSHEYLTSHGLDMTGCLGLKVDDKGWLVVPMWTGSNIASVQRISPEGEKKFWYGASVGGASYTINRKNASVTVLCEGLATGLAIFAAMPLSRVLVAFNAGNLSRVPAPKSGMVVVAADNDHATFKKIGRNPGVAAATEAAEAIGCGVAVPEGIEGTDWCDYRTEKYASKKFMSKLRDADIRRAIDADISAAMMRNARFVRRSQN